MSGLKAIRRRIVSVQNTKQITRAMKLVSAAKLRRAQEAALQGREFASRLGHTLQTVLSDVPADFSHPLLEERSECKKQLHVLISGERGLCGAFNANVCKRVQADALEDSTDFEVLAIGRKTIANARLFGFSIAGMHEGLSESALDWPAEEMAQKLCEEFLSGRVDQVVLYFTEFMSMVRQEVVRKVLLPISPTTLALEGEETPVSGMTKYDPEPQKLFSEMVSFYVITQLRQAGLESKASEHAARMRAMDSATRNADELTDKLRLFYNRARQSAITTELIDIVGGAEALT